MRIMKKLQVEQRHCMISKHPVESVFDLMFFDLGRKLKDESIVDYESSHDNNGVEMRLSTVCMKPTEHLNIGKVLRSLHERYPEDADVYALLFLFEEVTQ